MESTHTLTHTYTVRDLVACIGKPAPQAIQRQVSRSFVSWHERGLSVELAIDDHAVQTVYVYFVDKRFARCPDDWLPCGLKQDMKNQEVFALLGEPNSKNGGRVVDISLNYEHLGMIGIM